MMRLFLHAGTPPDVAGGFFLRPDFRSSGKPFLTPAGMAGFFCLYASACADLACIAISFLTQRKNISAAFENI